MKTFGFTAYLHVNYKSPVLLGPPTGGALVVRARATKVDGRKLFLEATLSDPSGARLFADAEALYVQPRPSSPSSAAVVQEK